MEAVWFWLVAGSLSLYVILDGFDLGAGFLHLAAARSENDRRTVLNAIGPFWDGNEVWLLATGGILYLAFPRVYASGFSGFYLPLTMVLWLLMLRGLGIELRHHIDSPLGRQACDAAFGLSSSLLAVLFGVALGNLVRGVPLRADGYFFVPLWTDLTVSPEPGAIDWFTASMGLTSFLVLTMHGGLFVMMKTGGDLFVRIRTIVHWAWRGTVLMAGFTVVAAQHIRPELFGRFSEFPAAWLLPALATTGLVLLPFYLRRQRTGRAFAASVVFIAGALASTAFALFPAMLISSGDPRLHLTAYNAGAPAASLATGLTWWIPGILIASGYFLFLYRSFRGKVRIEPEGY